MPDRQADPTKIRRLAQTLRFQIGPLEKAVRLASFLGRASEHPVLGMRLVLKGGTALNLYHADLPRLSVDADLNYVGQLGLDGMERERPQVFRDIEAIAKELGYAVVVEKDEHALRMYRLGYTGANGNHDHILLDLNFLERVPVIVPLASRDPPKALDVQGPSVKCLHLVELAGSKVATLLLRGACRDLFDVATLAGRTDVDWALARKIAVFHGFLADVGLGTMRMDRVQHLTQADYDRELRNLLRKGHAVSLGELKAAATPVAEMVLRLDEKEEACRQALLRGAWKPELLFGDAPINPDVARHPGMEWRLRNPHARMPKRKSRGRSGEHQRDTMKRPK